MARSVAGHGLSRKPGTMMELTGIEPVVWPAFIRTIDSNSPTKKPRQSVRTTGNKSVKAQSGAELETP